MRRGVFLFLIGALHICYQVIAAENVYIAELMVESNVTLEAQTLLALNTTDLEVSQTNGNSVTVTISTMELVAECLIVGDESTCNCNTGYIWSNEVCYAHNCCRETPCIKNVSDITPLCVAKVKVHITGSVTVLGTWDSSKTSQLKTEFGNLNGFEGLNVTDKSSGTVVDFEAAVSVKFNTSKLQDIVTNLKTSIGAVQVETEGMVTIESPEYAVCYQSEPELKCTFEEATDSAGWIMSHKDKSFELSDGSVVKLNHSCATGEYKSCVAVKLQGVTGIWSGSYNCGFTKGSVKHTAKTQLSVALLPEEITMTINPLTADCSKKQSSDHVHIMVNATILNSTEIYEVSWTYKATNPISNNTSVGDNLVYTFPVDVMCDKTASQNVTITFKNTNEQKKSASVDIPVIYDGEKCCPPDEDESGDSWPKTPDGDTVIIRTCAQGRVGYKSRTCEKSKWQPPLSNCVSEKLNQVLNAADNFAMGLGATQEEAKNIFEGLKNGSTLQSDSSDLMADINASINVLNTMAKASENFALEEDVLPDFVNAASNMLNNTWVGVNGSIVEQMSADYLQSVEGLVKNIKVNNSDGVNSTNLDLKFCKNSDCNVFVFDISVSLNKTNGVMKTIAVKNLMDKLKNNFAKTEPNSLLLSATLEDNNDSSIDITLEFPNQHNHNKPHCVFWNISKVEWSEGGCSVVTTDVNRTVCNCNHLTSFSVLMAKGDVSTEVLDIITNVGLGVSICSLLIFLIIESLVWSAVVKTNLSHFRHTAIVNISIFLLLADCSFLASSATKNISETWCLVLTVCKHLFFLAMFSWMLCLSVMLVHQLIFVFSPLRKRVFMFFSSIVGYVCPILIVGSSYVYCKYTNKPYYTKEKGCWLVYVKLLEGSIHAFLLPVGTVILTNLFSMVVVIFTLMKSSAPEGSKTDDKETVKSILKVVVFLTPVFGVTWIIGFAQLLLNENDPMFEVVLYSFTILNSFQGLFILITGCFAEQKVREEVIKLIMAKSRGKSESMKNLTATTYTKEK